MQNYECFAPGHRLPVETIAAETAWDARKVYAAKHGIGGTLGIIARRTDLIDDTWTRLADRHRRY
jgi:hypothetical protein